MHPEDIDRLKTQSRVVGEATDGLSTKADALETLCERLDELDDDYDDLDVKAGDLAEVFRRLSRELQLSLEAFHALYEAAELQQSRLGDVEEDIRSLLNQADDQAQTLRDVGREIEADVSRTSDLWRLASTGKRQTQDIKRAVDDLNLPQQIARRLPAEQRSDVEQDENLESFEDKTQAVQDKVHTIEEMLDELLR